MRPRALLVPLALALLGAVLPAVPARAFWPADGRPVCTSGTQELNPAMATDGAGGAILFWTDDRSSTLRLTMHHLLASGNMDGTLPVTGKQFSSVVTTGQYLAAVSDGAGGAIAVWQEQDLAGARQQIHALRVTSGGLVAGGWPDTGIDVSAATAGSGATNPVAVSDGAGGVVVAWQQTNSDTFGSMDVYAQRINGSGQVVSGWPSGGVAISAGQGNQYRPVIATDGAGGAVLAWLDQRDAPAGESEPVELFAQRVTGAGAVSWTAGGVAVHTGSNDVSDPAILEDGSNGAFVAFSSGPASGSTDLYAQRLAGATGAKQWGAGGTTVCSAANDQSGSQLAADGAGGVLLAWYDSRAAGSMDIYAQRLNSSGTVQWTANGVVICAATNQQELPHVVADALGGAVITWVDFRNNTWDMYAQRVNSSGAVQWAADGVAFCLSHNVDFTSPILVISDGSSGALVGWRDTRITHGIYAARITASGITGPTEVRVSSLQAQALEGAVQLSWSAFLDGPARFQVLRAEAEAGPYRAVGPELDAPTRQSDFRYTDASVWAGAVFFYKVGFRQAGDWEYSGTVRVVGRGAALELRVAGANPAAGAALLGYKLAFAGSTRLDILDVRGRLVRRLLEARLEPGAGSVRWDGRAADGARAPAGMYFARLASGERAVTCKLLRIE